MEASSVDVIEGLFLHENLPLLILSGLYSLACIFFQAKRTNFSLLFLISSDPSISLSQLRRIFPLRV
ncbi:hypothetical protein H5410_018378 [Solanum commersonii]|uniref:Uncharacterized protein n=1 Tax=Solanum commersonii TaxID=4109 RepID=A0A9J6A2M2_SOLCO|nr:hypothetical protein H5410_018378 [Solanum commersonii]